MASALATGLAEAGPDTLVMVDPNCRPAVIRDRATYLDRLDHVFRRADVVKVSVDDLFYLDPRTSAVDAARAIVVRGPRVVVLTDGGRAVVVVTTTDRFEVPVPEVDVIDTIGAGDAFGGAFLARWIERGLGPTDLADTAAVRDAVALSVEVASITCQRAGADPPRRNELGWPPRTEA
jgi:fructokinase